MNDGRYKVIKVDDNPQAQESWKAWTLRQGVRGIARAAESTLGLPGDLYKLGQKATNLVTDPFRNIVGLPSAEIDESIPSAENIKQNVTKPIGKLLPKGYLKPKHMGEEFIDEIASDFVPLFAGSGLKAGGAFIRSALGNVSKYIAKSFGAGENEQEAAKILTHLSPSLRNIAELTKGRIDARYDLAKKNIPASAKIDIGPLRDTFEKINTILKEGEPIKVKKDLNYLANLIKKHIGKGDVLPVKQILPLKNDINHEIKRLFGPGKLEGIEKVSYNLTDSLDKLAKNYAKINPKFGKPWTKAQELTAIFHKDPGVLEELLKHVSPKAAKAVRYTGKTLHMPGQSAISIATALPQEALDKPGILTRAILKGYPTKKVDKSGNGRYRILE